MTPVESANATCNSTNSTCATIADTDNNSVVHPFDILYIKIIFILLYSIVFTLCFFGKYMLWWLTILYLYSQNVVISVQMF